MNLTSSSKHFKVTDRDRGASKLLAKLLEQGALKVGILGDAAAEPHKDKDGEPSDLSVAQIGEIHEFGLGVPRRSFLAGWAVEREPEIKNVILRGGRALALGKVESVRVLLEQVGSWSVGSIQQRMAQNIPPPLAESTIKRKGSSVALIDTEQLRSSISYQVDIEAARR